MVLGRYRLPNKNRGEKNMFVTTMQERGKSFWVGIHNGVSFIYEQGTHRVEAYETSLDVAVQVMGGVSNPPIASMGFGYEVNRPELDGKEFETKCLTLYDGLSDTYSTR
jgi:hypothetical protein